MQWDFAGLQCSAQVSNNALTGRGQLIPPAASTTRTDHQEKITQQKQNLKSVRGRGLTESRKRVVGRDPGLCPPPRVVGDPYSKAVAVVVLLVSGSAVAEAESGLANCSGSSSGVVVRSRAWLSGNSRSHHQHTRFAQNEVPIATPFPFSYPAPWQATGTASCGRTCNKHCNQQHKLHIKRAAPQT